MNKAIFLDRDGVINEVLSKRVNFVNTPKDFYLLKGAGKAIKQFNDAGYKVFVVTNQGGIGLGYMSEDSLLAVHDKMVDEVEAYGGIIDDIAYCPHEPHANCACRKPKPRMILNLAKQYNIILAESYMVGDRAPDIEAGRLARTKTVLVGSRDEATEADLYFADLLSFSNWIC
ncbi:D-glycero-alpha-D-manno-heptose-1,7-bisphosphate 7-phosphatase [Virgibacillus sp. W0181]|uniref:D-glycero-alpha-D-manno-heptose-1,7-bisphosphate 7-phosphatase n=1 Tax=Virgibacillus sp. W0181 TaxID=3391581 RepID=UPI003F483E69